jgi:hypothetical protein
MKLVEADAEGPEIAGGDVVRPTPPRPERRRVVVSLGFTIAVLIGTVVTIYTVFPARHDHLAAAALEAHHQVDTGYQLIAPGPAELRGWTVALLGEAPPVPAPSNDVKILGARPLTLLKRPAAVLRYRIGGNEVTLLVQRTRVTAHRATRHEGIERAETWHRGVWTYVAVGPEATASTWERRVGVP